MEWLFIVISLLACGSTAKDAATSGKWLRKGLLMAAWAMVPLFAFQGSAVTAAASVVMLFSIPFVLLAAKFAFRREQPDGVGVDNPRVTS
jgi:hypothetical protein